MQRLLARSSVRRGLTTDITTTRAITTTAATTPTTPTTTTTPPTHAANTTTTAKPAAQKLPLQSPLLQEPYPLPGFERPLVRIQNQMPVYMDFQATTPMDPRALAAMLPYFTVAFGNPHSRTHAYGWESEKAVEVARAHVAALIGADPKEIIFTSGATESNNMSVKGVARFYKEHKRHLVTTQTEHKCVLDSARHLQESEGFTVTYLPVKKDGLVDLQQLADAIRPGGMCFLLVVSWCPVLLTAATSLPLSPTLTLRPSSLVSPSPRPTPPPTPPPPMVETSLVSIMAVNNEIGVIQPLEEIGRICREKKAFFHTDAAQAVGKIPIDVQRMNIDLMSISGHKVYGPKGIGACYVRRRPRVRMEPIITGGGQERGLRSGTVPTPLVVGLGEACRIAKEEMEVGQVGRVVRREVACVRACMHAWMGGWVF